MRTSTLALSYVLIFLIPWEGVVDLPGLGTAAKLMGFVMAAFWVATVVLTGRFRKPRLFQYMACLFVLWIVASIFWSTDPSLTTKQLATWVQLLVLVFILWDLYTTRATVLGGLQAFVLGAFVAIGFAVGNFVAGNAYYTHYQRFSPAADTNPDGFGFMLALGIPVAWYLASSENMPRLQKLVNYAYIPAAFLGIALSGTRTAMVASIPGMVFGLVSLTRLKVRTRVAVFMLLACMILILLPSVESLKSFQRFSTTATELTQGDLNGRVALWREGIRSFAEHPILGIGYNTYRTVNSVGKVAHNSFLSVLVQLGLLGFVLFGSILTIAITQAWIQPRWDALFWFSVLTTWTIGAFTLTWEDQKETWVFLSLLVASAALTTCRGNSGTPVLPADPEAQPRHASRYGQAPGEAHPVQID